MQRLEYVQVHCVSRCVAYSSTLCSHPRRPTSACSEIGFVFPGLLKPVNHRVFEGLTYFPAMRETEHEGFMAIKHLTKEELRLRSSPTVKVRKAVPILEQ